MTNVLEMDRWNALQDELRRSRERNARLVAALEWMENLDPELVGAAREKFAITENEKQ
jgi:hypothetical protein